MRYRRKLWHRKLRFSLGQMRSSKRRWQLFLLSCALTAFVYILILSRETKFSSSDSKHCDIIDVVYTWVNGSDPEFIAAVKRYNHTYDPTRFDDKNELRYSLRSLEKHANWIRHVYIVTNGQIPNWLDLSYERVTVVPHEQLAQDVNNLPTFSSAAIETFIHRIPKLSKRFLYLNDDIFLGATLYPEDLYSQAEGVRIYQAWMVPDCATDCPWTYIGDSACDRHCNIEECQFDGGDCNEMSTEVVISQQSDEHKSNLKPNDGQAVPIQTAVAPTTALGLVSIRKPRLIRKLNRYGTNFKEYIRRRNMSTLEELKSIVHYFNNDKLQTRVTNNLSSNSNVTKVAPISKQLLPKTTYKSSTDIYSHSLIYTNMLLNHAYGFKARNVIAHVGFLLDSNIISEMQAKFHKEVQITASQRFRAPTDLQFAFAYYSFLMSETKNLSIMEIFDEFDTDHSGTWSDREVRTLLTRLYSTPLDWSAMRYFEEVIGNCTRRLNLEKSTNNIVYSTLIYERYEDSNLPLITRDLVVQCPLLVEALKANFANRPKYKYNINPKRNTHCNFMMLTSNITVVVDELDRLRRYPRKFNCINDNLDSAHSDENELIRHLLEDFYLSFFPQRSKFELEPQYRNRFVNWHDYQRWRRRKRAALFIGYGFSILLSTILIRFVCIHKAKFVRRCIQSL